MHRLRMTRRPAPAARCSRETAVGRGRLPRLLPALALLAAVLACQTTPPTREPGASLAIGAATSAQPLLESVMEVYRVRAPGVTIVPEYGNAQLVLGGLRSGRVAAALVAWPGGDLPQDLWAQPVAVDALAVVVNRVNPVRALSLYELREIFQGRADAWPAPPEGADALPVEVVVREEGSSARTLFERSVMGDQRVTLTAIVMPGSDETVDYVAAHPGAIGYVSMSWLDDRVHALEVEGVVPLPDTARDQSYPLLTPVYFFSRSEPQEELRDLYLFLIDPAGQAVVETRYGRVR